MDFTTTSLFSMSKLPEKKKKEYKIEVSSNLSEINLEDFIKHYARFVSGVCCLGTDITIKPAVENKTVSLPIK